MGRDEDEARLRDDAERDAVRLAGELAADFTRLLGDRVVAVILHGSLVLGDFMPGRSDIDVLVVVERPLNDGGLKVVQAAIVARRENAPGGIDVRVVTRAAAASPTQEPAMELYVGLHGDEEPEILTRVIERDLVAELSMARADGPEPLRRGTLTRRRRGPGRVGRRLRRPEPRPLGATDRRREACRADGAHDLPDLAVYARGRPLLEEHGRALGARARPVAHRRRGRATARAGELDAVVESSDIAALIARVRSEIRDSGATKA